MKCSEEKLVYILKIHHSWFVLISGGILYLYFLYSLLIWYLRFSCNINSNGKAKKQQTGQPTFIFLQTFLILINSNRIPLLFLLATKQDSKQKHSNKNPEYCFLVHAVIRVRAGLSRMVRWKVLFSEHPAIDHRCVSEALALCL